MDSDVPWNPLGIMLSMYGSRINSKLLFKYPFKTDDIKSSCSYQQLTSSTFQLNSPSVGPNNADDQEMESDIDTNHSREFLEQYLGFSDETLGQLLSPGNTKICGQNFDVKINGIRFVGFPLVPEKCNLDCNRVRPLQFSSKNLSNYQQASNNSAATTTILSFNLVFVLKTNADYSVIESYQQLAAKIGLALRFEETRDNYITKETKKMLNIHEEYETCPVRVHKQILKKSKLAQNLKGVFDDLTATGIIDFLLNDNIWITFCIYHKVHNSFNLGGHHDAVKIEAVEESLSKIQPYHGILVFNISTVWNSLKPASSSTMIKFLNVYKPTKSLQGISTDADMSITHTYTIARHLVHWGKACVIYPMCESNVYVLAPTATLFYLSKWVAIFHETFQMNLIEVLSYFSQPVSLGDSQLPTGPFFGHEKHLVEVVYWMLQHRFLVQHHTYISFLPHFASELQLTNQQVVNLFLDVSRKHFSTGIEFHQLPDLCQSVFKAIPAAHNTKDLSLFLKLLPYMDGKHHLEEMMYRENMMRPDLLTILEKFRPVLLTAVREDEIATSFWMNT
uniref:GATOR complex protein NPRL3 n=1 Tax=Phallusia mammillata TaxID=59560 RepID=A0A6F9DN18_9ASCI|nr:nitrogen permease regulator 3-like protein [Phallusia mammillata]